eukprot:4192839-Pleurochrysis_carterae.AAC.1
MEDGMRCYALHMTRPPLGSDLCMRMLRRASPLASFSPLTFCSLARPMEADRRGAARQGRRLSASPAVLRFPFRDGRGSSSRRCGACTRYALCAAPVHAQVYGPAIVCEKRTEWSAQPPTEQARLNARQGSTRPPRPFVTTPTPTPSLSLEWPRES